MVGRKTCSVNGCKNTYQNTIKMGKMVSFYSFPKQAWLKEKRHLWIQFARKENNEDGSAWQPKTGSTICSEHFWGGERSEDPRKLNYNPTIYNNNPGSGKVGGQMARKPDKPRHTGSSSVLKPDPEMGICVFCSATSGFKSAKGYLSYPSFTKFCTQIMGDTKKSETFVNTLSSFDSLTVCGSCLSLTSAFANRDEDVIRAEAQVTRLQLELLEKLQNLHRRIKEFHEEMDNIKQVVQLSDAELIKEAMVLEANSNPEVYEQTLENKGGPLILNFRHQVVTVGVRLEKFEKKLKDKVNYEDPVELKVTPDLGIFDDLLSIKRDDDESSEAPHTPSSSQFYNEASDIEEDDDNAKISVKPLVALQEDDIKVKCDLHETSDDDSISENDIDSEEGSQDPDPLQQLDQEAEESEEDDDDEDYNLKEQVGNRCETEEAETHNFKGMSTFRRKVIKRVLLKNKIQRSKERSKLSTAKRKEARPLFGEKPDWLENHPYSEYPIEYNVEKDWLHVRDLGILIHDKDKTLECAQCHFVSKDPKVNRSRTVEMILWNHLLSRHFDLYCCPICSSRLCTLSKFREHVQGHQNKYLCDICGRPCSSRGSLTGHRWTHMSVDEQQAALEKGVAEPCTVKYKRLQKLEAGKPHECPQCRKRFKTAAMVREHEETHKDVRDRVLCARCGRHLLPKNVRSHQLYCGVTSTDFKCDVCQKAFKNRFLLKNHRKQHFAEANFLCASCPKAFKTAASLRTHQISHSENRPFICEKGCGGGFKNKRGALRHAQLCQGKGTPFRKKAKQVVPPTFTEPMETPAPSSHSETVTVTTALQKN